MYLLNKGADPTIQNGKGETVMALLSKFNLDLLDGKEGNYKYLDPSKSEQVVVRSVLQVRVCSLVI